MDVLPRRGKEAYRHFYDVLVDRDEKVAAELVGQKLQEQPEEEQQVPDSWAVFHTLPAVDDELPERWPDDATHDPKRVEVVKVHPEDIEMTTRFERASTGKSPLGFYVVIKTDLTASEMLAAFREQAAFDHSQYDCFACALLSHGDVDDTLFGTDGQSVKLDQLQDALDGKNCPTLNGKPKLFFVGSGRGGELDEGVERDIETPASSDDGNPTESVQADRKEKATGKGVHCADCAAGLVLDNTQNSVNRLVSTAESTTSASFLTGKKQMPVFTSSLTREFYFFPGLQHGDVGSDTQATVNTSTSTQEQTS
nr:hypothetical protein BaRGS_015895 [Batillaria attramentaria]